MCVYSTIQTALCKQYYVKSIIYTVLCKQYYVKSSIQGELVYFYIIILFWFCLMEVSVLQRTSVSEIKHFLTSVKENTFLLNHVYSVRYTILKASVACFMCLYRIEELT